MREGVAEAGQHAAGVPVPIKAPMERRRFMPKSGRN